MTEEDFEPIRIRIMQEAYDCADRGEAESYNSIKVMCSEVQRMVETLVAAEREACAIEEIKKLEAELDRLDARCRDLLFEIKEIHGA